MDRWVGRVALVTGASAGIGVEICKVLVKAGMKVVGAARGVEKIQALAQSLKDAKGSLTAIKCDLSKDEDVYKLFDEIKTKFGGVDVCVNNAGMATAKKLLDSTPEEWRAMTDLNIIALCLCSKLSITSMRERGVDDGHIINIGSILGHIVAQSTASKFYSGTKFAVRAITEGLRQEMRELKSHIRITSVSPGLVETEFMSRLLGGNDELAKKIYSSALTLKPEDVAASVLHAIASPAHVEINEIIIRSTEHKI